MEVKEQSQEVKKEPQQSEQAQLKQLKLNVTNIKSILIKKNQNTKKSDKKEDDQEKKKLSVKKKKEEEKKLTAGTSSLRRMASSVKGALAKPGGSLFDKMMDFGLIVLTGILVNALPAIVEKIKKVFKAVMDFITPAVDGFKILIDVVNIATGNSPDPKLDKAKLDLKKDIEDGADTFLKDLEEKAGPLGGLVKMLSPLIKDLVSKFGNKLSATSSQTKLAKNEAGEEGLQGPESGFVKQSWSDDQRARFQKGDTRAYVIPKTSVAQIMETVDDIRDDHGPNRGSSDPSRQTFALPTTSGQTTAVPANVTGFNAGSNGSKNTLIYLHWTAGEYDGNGSYHTVFAGDGSAKRNSSYDTLVGHTEGKNTNSVGLSIAAAKGATDLNRMGSYPPTQAQLNAMTAEAARLAIAWGWSESDINKNVWTHAEAGSGLDPRGLAANHDKNGDGKPDNYGPSEWGGSVDRWDLYGLRKGAAKGSGGPELRDMIKQHYRRFKKGQTVSRADHNDAQISPTETLNASRLNQSSDNEGEIVFVIQPIVIG